MHPVGHHALSHPRDERGPLVARSPVRDEPGNAIRPHDVSTTLVHDERGLHGARTLTHPCPHDASAELTRDERGPPDPLAALALSPRDRQILALARRLAASLDFSECVRALIAATAERIPAGRVYLLARTADGPALGSVVSGVGLAPADDGPRIIRVDRHGRVTQLGSLR